jgi:hypothetical protein
VLGAGEIAFSRGGVGWAIGEVSKDSTGYCPDLGSWPAVVGVLYRVGLGHGSSAGVSCRPRGTSCEKPGQKAKTELSDMLPAISQALP